MAKIKTSQEHWLLLQRTSPTSLQNFGNFSAEVFPPLLSNAFLPHLQTHIHNIEDVAHESDCSENHQGGKAGASKDPRVPGKPKQETCRGLEVDRTRLDWRRLQPNDADSAADDAHHKGGNHDYPVSADGSRLILSDELNCFEPLRELCHELGTIVEMRLLSQKEGFYVFVFRHNGQ